MKAIRLPLVGCLVLSLAVLGLEKNATRAQDAEKAEDNKDKIVGIWEVVKSETGSAKGDTATFTKDGKLKLTATQIGFTVEFTYTVEGDKIKRALKGSKAGDTMTIRELTATRLVTVDGLRKTTEYKRKK
jgi:uncharacterized protein (TIGR03066 family)